MDVSSKLISECVDDIGPRTGETGSEFLAKAQDFHYHILHEYNRRAALHRIPPEILCYIALHSIIRPAPEDRVGLANLETARRLRDITSVCWYWRQIFIEDGSLWAGVPFHWKGTPYKRVVGDSLYIWTKGIDVSGSTLDQVKLHLERSKNHPFDLSIALDVPRECSPPPLHELAHLLHPHLDRCRSIHLKGEAGLFRRQIFPFNSHSNFPVISSLWFEMSHSVKRSPEFEDQDVEELDPFPAFEMPIHTLGLKSPISPEFSVSNYINPLFLRRFTAYAQDEDIMDDYLELAGDAIKLQYLNITSQGLGTERSWHAIENASVETLVVHNVWFLREEDSPDLPSCWLPCLQHLHITFNYEDPGKEQSREGYFLNPGRMTPFPLLRTLSINLEGYFYPKTLAQLIQPNTIIRALEFVSSGIYASHVPSIVPVLSLLASDQSAWPEEADQDRPPDQICPELELVRLSFNFPIAYATMQPEEVSSVILRVLEERPALQLVWNIPPASERDRRGSMDLVRVAQAQQTVLERFPERVKVTCHEASESMRPLMDMFSAHAQ